MWGPVRVGGVSQFPIYRDLGINVFQDALSWPSIAARRPGDPTDPSDPAYRWPSAIADAIHQARRYHMRIMLEIRDTPAWANGGRASNYAPLSAADFANFTTAAARRYASVRLWMIYGEPNRAANFAPLTPARPSASALTPAQAAAPHRYAVLLDAGYGALKAVNRANLVIGGNTYTGGQISPLQWIENLRLPDGRPPRMDLYGHNPFSFRTPTFANPPSPGGRFDFSDLARLYATANHYLGRGRRIELYVSEWTIPTAPDDEFDFYVKPGIQAAWITDAWNLLNQHRGLVYSLGWIHLYDQLPETGGGLIYANGVRKPGYLAFKNG
jgi:hypothetical protein